MPQTMMLIEKSSHCASFYDVMTGERQGRVPLPDFPHEFVIDPDYRYAYVGHYGVQNSGVAGTGGRAVVVIDLRIQEIVHRYDLGEHARPHGIEMDAQGRLYVLSEWTQNLLIKDHPADFSTGFDRMAPTGGKKSHLFALQLDGERAYSMNLGSGDVTVLAPHDRDIRPVSIRTGNRPEGRCLRADEKILFTTNRGDNTVAVVDTQALAVISTFPTPDDPVRIFHDTKRHRLVTINCGDCSVSFFDDTTGEELKRHETPASPVALCFDAAQDFAYISIDCEQVQRLDLNSFDVAYTFETEKEPDVMRILPDGFADQWGKK